MTIDDNDLYYGAAFKQIADHKLFKSINAEWQADGKSRCAYRINTDIGVYIRAATKPMQGEYVFNFKKENMEQVGTGQSTRENLQKGIRGSRVLQRQGDQQGLKNGSLSSDLRAPSL